MYIFDFIIYDISLRNPQLFINTLIINDKSHLSFEICHLSMTISHSKSTKMKNSQSIYVT